MMVGSRLAGIMFASVAFGACAHVNPEPAFHDVAEAVTAQTGQSPRWARTDDAMGKRRRRLARFSGTG